MNETINNILTRRSVRKFTNKKVEEEKLDLILKCGTFAPSGRGKQSPIIISVRDENYKKRLSKLNAQIMNVDIDPYYNADVIILVLADPNINTYIEDASCTLENMMIAAHSLNVGSVWIHLEKEMFETDEGKQLLKEWNIPSNYQGVGALALGYGEASQAKPRKENYIYKF